MNAFFIPEKFFSDRKRSLKTITLANFITFKKQDCIFSVKTHILTSFCPLQSPIVYLYSGKHSIKAEVGKKCLVVKIELFLKPRSNEENSFYEINY
jgi:hypothetical protein